MSSRRLVWIDALRVVDAALVVLVHTDYLARPDPFTWWPFGIASTLLYGLCVPVFFAIAGFVGARSSAADLARRAARFVPLLLLHGVVLLVLGVHDVPTLAAQLRELVMGVWYLYFLSAFVQLLLVHAAIERWLPTRRGLFFALAVLATAATYAASSARLWLVGADMGMLDTTLRSFGSTWAAFYAIGVALGRDEARMASATRRAGALVVAAIPLAFLMVGEYLAEDARYHHATTLQTGAGGLPYQLVATVAVLAIASRAGRFERVTALLARAAPATLSVYLLHGTMLWLVYRAWLRHGAFVHPLEVPALAIAATACALVARAVLRFLPAPLPWVLAGVRLSRPSRPSRRP